MYPWLCDTHNLPINSHLYDSLKYNDKMENQTSYKLLGHIKSMNIWNTRKHNDFSQVPRILLEIL